MQRNSMKTISNMYITFSVPLFSQGIPILNAMEFCSNLEIPMDTKFILCLQITRTKPRYQKALELWKCAKHRTKFYKNNLKLVHYIFSPVMLARYSNFKWNGILFKPRNSDEHKIYSMPPNN